ncbi:MULTISPECIES: transcriptional regulator [unclassified Castellaniella]|jgi:y4mF family transcriptional regulator|uniref:transcriptional regulator n=1 Tax=unclassified Castellaniella TaxID=2617606 RepID=UPI003315F832
MSTSPGQPPDTPVRTAQDLGQLIRVTRQAQALRQSDLAGLSGTGNRFIVDLEHGKPTMQLQKVLDMIDLLGLEVIIRCKRR